MELPGDSLAWWHPDPNKYLDMAGLEIILQAESSWIMVDIGLTLLLIMQALGLRPRRPIEKNE